MVEDVYIGQKVIILSHQIDRAIGREVAQYGITNIQSRIILFISRESSKRRIYQKDIEEKFNIRRSSVTSVLNLMENNGYIKRVNVAEDGRLKQIVLLEKGIELEQSVHNAILKIENQLAKAFTKKERELFFTLSDKLSSQVLGLEMTQKN